MKETGITRRIDEMGRVVIPKEIRRSLNIKDGEDLEIFIEKNRICLEKYSKLFSLEEIAQQIVSLAYEELNLNYIIFDQEKVIASYVAKYLHYPMNIDLGSLLKERIIKETQYPSFLLQDLDHVYTYILPIIIEGNGLGLFILVKESEISAEEKKITNFLKQLIVNKIDIL